MGEGKEKMQHTISKRYLDLAAVAGVISHLFSQCLLGSLLLYEFFLLTGLMSNNTTLQVMPFLSDSSYLSLVMVTMLLALSLHVLALVYRRHIGNAGPVGMSCWMLTYLANSLSLGILSTVIYSAYMLGMNVVAPHMDQLLMLLFAGLLIAAAAQMRYLDEIAGDAGNTLDRATPSTRHQSGRSVHNLLLAVNLFIVTIMTYTGVEGDIGMYAGIVVMASIVAASIVERIVPVIRLKKSQGMDDVELLNKKHMV